MAITQAELGRRIGKGREQAGLSQAQLAQAVGLGQSAVSRIESGDRSIDALELTAICRTLGVSPLDLLEDRPVPESVIRLSARLQTARSPGAIDLARSRVLDLVRIDDLLTKLGVPSRGPVEPMRLHSKARLHKDQGRDLALTLRATLDLGDQPIPDLVEVVEGALGLDVALEPLPDSVEGLCVRTDNLSIALVNSATVVGRQRFTLAHEVGHYVAGDVDPFLVDEDLFGTGASEIRANSFAAHFLMPEHGLKGRLRGRPIDGGVLCELQYAFGVSLDALLWQLQNVGMITRSQRTRFRQSGPRNLALRHGYVASWSAARSSEGQVRPPGRIARRALQGYEMGVISVERLALVLGRPDVEELRLELEDAGIVREQFPKDTAPA